MMESSSWLCVAIIKNITYFGVWVEEAGTVSFILARKHSVCGMSRDSPCVYILTKKLPNS